MIHKIELSPECWRVLTRLRASGTLEARRVFPQEHRFYLSKPGGGEYASAPTASAIASLLQHKLLLATPVDRQADRIKYTLTPRGDETAIRGELTFDDENIDWTAAA